MMMGDLSAADTKLRYRGREEEREEMETRPFRICDTWENLINWSIPSVTVAHQKSKQRQRLRLKLQPDIFPL